MMKLARPIGRRVPEHAPPADFRAEELRVAFLLGRQHGGLPLDVFVLEILRPMHVGGRFLMPVLLDQDRVPLALADGQEFSAAARDPAPNGRPGPWHPARPLSA